MTQTEIAMRPLDADIEDADAFMRYAQERKPVSHAQLRQDLWALWESGGRTGYFVEIGAGDGHNLSNTLLLEKLGWNGLVVEANPSYADALRSNRKCSVELGCVHSRNGESVDFLIARNRHLSRIAEIRSDDRFEAQRNHGASVISVPTVTFDAALERHAAPRRIDYLSIDVEGAELLILKTIDFSRWDVRAITVEHNRTAQRDGIFDLLTAAGFRRKWPDVSKCDDWYVKAD